MGVFSPDGKRGVTAFEDIIPRASGTPTYPACSSAIAFTNVAVLTIVFTSDNKRILTASADGTARIWNAYDNQQCHYCLARPRSLP